MSYVSPPDKTFSPVDIEWLERVYGPPKSKSTPSISKSTLSKPQFDVPLEDKVTSGYGTYIFMINIIVIWFVVFFTHMKKN
jgi:hypothetical protein